MTIPASPRRMPAVVTNGVTTVFTFDFLVFTTTDVRAVWRPSGGESVDLFLNIDYTVSLNPDQSVSPGGTITTIGPSSPRPAGGTITILGQLEFKQATDVPNSGPFFGDTIERMVDYQAILIQQLRELLSRTMTVGPADGSIPELPSTAARANRILGFDAVGAPIPVQGSSSVPVTPFMATVLGSTTAAAARGTLGATAVGSAVFTATDAASARTAIGATIVNKNRFANGAFAFDQRNNGAVISVPTGSSDVPTLDCARASVTGTGAFTVQQVATSGLGPPGASAFTRMTVTTADPTMAATDQYQFYALIEGVDIADLGWGAAGALPISIGFWFRSSLTGTFSGSIRNAAVARSYPISWTYSVANVWQFVPVPNIPGDTTGAWPTNNARSMIITFSLGAGSNQSGTAGAWTAANLTHVTGAVNLISTNGATMDIALLQVESGTACTPFEWVPYQAGLAKVQRYYERTYNVGTPNGSPTNVGAISIYSDSLPSAANRTVANTWQFKVSKRTTPTAVTFFGNSGVAGAVAMAGGNMTAILSFVSQNHAVVQATDTSTNGAAQIVFQAVAEAEL